MYEYNTTVPSILYRAVTLQSIIASPEPPRMDCWTLAAGMRGLRCALGIHPELDRHR